MSLPRSFVPRTTDSALAVRAAPNSLLGHPSPLHSIGPVSATSRTCPGKAVAGATWPGGGTAARTKSSVGTCALATSEDLLSEALRRALVVRHPATALTVHSDQGSQYTATRFKELLTRTVAV